MAGFAMRYNPVAICSLSSF